MAEEGSHFKGDLAKHSGKVAITTRQPDASRVIESIPLFSSANSQNRIGSRGSRRAREQGIDGGAISGHVPQTELGGANETKDVNERNRKPAGRAG